MRQPILILAMCATLATGAAEVNFDQKFEDRTLKLDYILAGNQNSSAIYLDELSSWDGWAGRRHNLDQPLLQGNGGITVRDHATGDTIYTNTFSTLFQEWQTTPEAAAVSRSYEATFLVPYPKDTVDVTVYLTNNRCQRVAELTHTVNPADILIRKHAINRGERRDIRQSGLPAEKIDLVIIGEGYSPEETEKFFKDAARADEALFTHEPFASMADRFNVIAIATPSASSGPSVPHDGDWRPTAFDTHYDTFYWARYLTTNSIHKIHDAVAGVPYEHVIMLVNTPIYGGGGFFNTLTVAAADNAKFKPVLVHEFGHAFGGLADEYFTYDDMDGQYPLDIEPWEPNITSLTHFERKWPDMIPAGTPTPTPPVDLADLDDIPNFNADDPANAPLIHELTTKVGLYEGAGYRKKGLFRPTQECRMKGNITETFCPVCARAIVRMIDFYTK